MKVLIAYHSVSGNTKKVAEAIYKEIKGDKGCKGLLGAALIALFVLCPGRHAQSEEMGDAKSLSPKDMIVRAWEAWGAKDYDKTFYWTDECIKAYSEEAKKEQGSLTSLPSTDAMDQYETLNAVGTSFFIQGEAYLSQGKIEEAKKAFGIAIKDYSFAQNWDPRGWYWSVKEKC